MPNDTTTEILTTLTTNLPSLESDLDSSDWLWIYSGITGFVLTVCAIALICKVTPCKLPKLNSKKYEFQDPPIPKNTKTNIELAEVKTENLPAADNSETAKNSM